MRPALTLVVTISTPLPPSRDFIYRQGRFSATHSHHARHPAASLGLALQLAVDHTFLSQDGRAPPGSVVGDRFLTVEAHAAMPGCVPSSTMELFHDRSVLCVPHQSRSYRLQQVGPKGSGMRRVSVGTAPCRCPSTVTVTKPIPLLGFVCRPFWEKVLFPAPKMLTGSDASSSPLFVLLSAIFQRTVSDI